MRYHIGYLAVFGVRHKVKYNLCIGRGSENRALPLHMLAKYLSVNEISVVRSGYVPSSKSYKKRLGVYDVCCPCCRISVVSYGCVADQRCQCSLIGKNIGDEPESFAFVHFSAVSGDYPRAFLPAMLESIQAKVGHLGCLGVPYNTEYAAVFV